MWLDFRRAGGVAHLGAMTGTGPRLDVVSGWAERHHGVVSRRRAMELGWSSAAWYRAIDRGVIELIRPGVARLYGTDRSPLQRIHALVIAVGDSAMASHRSGATLWGIERPADDPVDVIVPRGRTRIDVPGVVVHRPTDRDDLKSTVRQGTPTTNLLRTMVDLGAVVGSVEDAVSAAITSGAVTPAVLHHLLARHSRPGRHGVGALRRALDGWPLQGRPPDSELEVRMARLLHRYRLPPATFHPRIAGFEVDFLIDGSNLVIECDGWDHHGRTREQFEWDRERDVELGAAGYVVLHVTWRQVTRRAAWTAERIRATLQQWSPHVLDVSAALLRGC